MFNAFIVMGALIIAVLIIGGAPYAVGIAATQGYFAYDLRTKGVSTTKTVQRVENNIVPTRSGPRVKGYKIYFQSRPNTYFFSALNNISTGEIVTVVEIPNTINHAIINSKISLFSIYLSRHGLFLSVLYFVIALLFLIAIPINIIFSLWAGSVEISNAFTGKSEYIKAVESVLSACAKFMSQIVVIVLILSITFLSFKYVLPYLVSPSKFEQYISGWLIGANLIFLASPLPRFLWRSVVNFREHPLVNRWMRIIGYIFLLIALIKATTNIIVEVLTRNTWDVTTVLSVVYTAIKVMLGLG